MQLKSSAASAPFTFIARNWAINITIYTDLCKIDAGNVLLLMAPSHNLMFMQATVSCGYCVEFHVSFHSC